MATDGMSGLGIPGEESRLGLLVVDRPFVDEAGSVLSANCCCGATIATAAGADDAAAGAAADAIDAAVDAGVVAAVDAGVCVCVVGANDLGVGVGVDAVGVAPAWLSDATGVDVGVTAPR